MKTLFGSHLQVSSKVMDLRMERQNLVMGNLANVDTPNYKPRRIEFEDELKKAVGNDPKGRLTRTEGEHMPGKFSSESFDGNVIKEFQPRFTYGQDGVNMDKEMAIMQKNMLHYQTLSTVMANSFRGMKKVITESKQ